MNGYREADRHMVVVDTPLEEGVWAKHDGNELLMTALLFPCDHVIRRTLITREIPKRGQPSKPSVRPVWTVRFIGMPWLVATGWPCFHDVFGKASSSRSPAGRSLADVLARCLSLLCIDPLAEFPWLEL